MVSSCTCKIISFFKTPNDPSVLGNLLSGIRDTGKKSALWWFFKGVRFADPSWLCCPFLVWLSGFPHKQWWYGSLEGSFRPFLSLVCLDYCFTRSPFLRPAASCCCLFLFNAHFNWKWLLIFQALFWHFKLC